MAAQRRLDEKNNIKDKFFSKPLRRGLQFSYTIHTDPRIYVKTIQADVALIVTPLLAVALASCGGGGGGESAAQVNADETRLPQEQMPEEQIPQEQMPQEQVEEEQIPPPQRAGQIPVLEITPPSFFINEGRSTARKLADIDVTNDEENTIRVTIPTSAIFEIRTNTETGGNELWLRAGVELDFDVAQTHTIILTPVTGTDEAPEAKTFTLRLNNIVSIVQDIKPISMTISAQNAIVNEGISTAQKLADIGFIDDGQGTNAVTILPHPVFEIRNSNELWLKGGINFNYETTPTHIVTLIPDVTGLGEAPAELTFILHVNNIDEVPSVFALSRTSGAVPVLTGTSTRTKLADIIIADDGLGINAPSLTAGSAYFEIAQKTDGDLGLALYLKAGQSLVSAASHVATLALISTGIGTPPAPIEYRLNVLSVIGSTNERVIEDSRRFNTEKGHIALQDAVAGISYSLAVEPISIPDSQPSLIVVNNTNVVGQYGTLIVDPNGVWDYVLNNNDPDTNALNSGDIGRDIFTFTYTDNTGQTFSRTLTLNIEGRTDHTMSGSTFNQASATAHLTVHDVSPALGQVVINTGSGNDIILPDTSGTAGNNYARVNTGAGNDEIYGGAGGDILNGGSDDDYLSGEEGFDMLSGGTGNDIFVLYLAARNSGDLDIVRDFESGDKIEVDTYSGRESTFAAIRNVAGIRWTQDSDARSTGTVTTLTTNDRNLNDILIYATKYTSRTDDDFLLMVIEDYTTPLTIDNFEVV